MALPDTPLTRDEMYLNAIANESSDVPTPLTREEQFLSAIANKDASGLPPPITREEQYLLAIASGDASGIPDIPLTRVEQYLGAIANGSDSYPSIPLTRMEQYLEYIAQNGGGGGVPGSLEECGWVRSLNGKATVSGNVIDMPTGSTGTYAAIAPPTDIHASRYFVNGDELVVAIKVTEVSHRLAGQQPGTTVSVMTDTTELFTIDGGSGYTTRTGEDVLTWSFTSTAKDGIRFRPLWSNGSTASNCYATLEITGMKFNGSVIYGKG